MVSTSSNAFATFSGGGWNSHTVSSAMVGGALDAARKSSQTTVELGMPTLFDGIDGLAGNSGGSWFVSMLTYSQDFASDLANQASDWFSTGYMGQQQQLIGITSKQAAATALNGVLESIVAQNVSSLPLYDQIKSAVFGNTDVAGFLATTIFGTLSKAVIDVVLAATPDSAEPEVENIAGLVSLSYNESNDGKTPNWMKIVKDVAFGSYGMTEKLSDPITMNRLDWAADKSLIIGAAKPMAQTISYADSNYLNSFVEASTSVAKLVDAESYYTPITMVLQPQGEGYPEDQLIFTAGDLNLNYEQRGLLGQDKAQATTTLSNLSIDELSIIDVATISSSFAGAWSVLETYPGLVKAATEQLESSINSAIESNGIYQALPGFLQRTVMTAVDTVVEDIGASAQDTVSALFSVPLANFMADMAVPVQTADGKAVVAEPYKNGDLQDIVNAGNVRLLDGGYTDNTAVANILGQLKGIDGPFEVTAFVNNTVTAEIPAAWTGHDALTVGTNIPMLFGTEGDALVRPFENLPGSPLAAYPAIFDQSAWQSEKPVWSYVDSATNTVIDYYQLDVQTINNPLFGVEANKTGVLNVFSTYNTGSGPGPYFANAFDIYENIYNATRTGIISNGGYIHVLESLGSMRLEWSQPDASNDARVARDAADGGHDASQIRMIGSDGLSSKMTLSVKEVSTDQDIFLDVYKIDAAEKSSFVGTLGGSAQEQDMGHQGLFDLFRLGVGETLEFRPHGTSTEQAQKPFVFDYTRGDSAYALEVIDPETQAAVMALDFAYVPLESAKDGLFVDQTERDDVSDAYIYLKSGMSVDFSLQAPAAMQNTFSMVQIEIDETTGLISFDGHLQDTLEFDQAVRAAIENNTFFDKVEVEPFSASDQAVTGWQPAEDGYYAPVLLTKEDNLYVAGHDLVAGSSQARVVGYCAFAFEDLAIRSGADCDFNDLIIQMNVYNAA